MKTRITTYTFDASAKTITFGGALDIEGFTIINNVVDNVIIYNFNDPLKGGTFLTNTLTLTYDTSSMSDTDELMILYEDGINTQVVSGTVTANAGTNLNTSALAVEVGGNLAAIKTNTDDIETLLTTIEGNQLPDGHEVEVNNLPTEYPLPAAQVSTLTPPAAITGFATSAKQLADNHQVTVSNIANTPVITGFATSAKQDTIAGYVDGIEGYVDGMEGLLTTIDADTSNISTKIDTLAGAVAGTEVQVDVLTMPTTTVQGTITANLSATDNAVLDDIAANQTDGTQKTQIIDAGGEAVTVTGGKLDVNASIDTTGLATSAKQDTIIGHIDGIEGYVDGIETTLTAINNKLVTGTDIGDVTINNSTGANAVNIQDGGNTITVDGTVTANTGLSQPLTDTQLRATAVPISVATIPSHAVTNAGTFPVQATLAAETTKVIGTVNIAASQTVGLPGSGMSIFRSIDLDESEEDVKTSAGTLYGWYIQNKNVATLYLKFYNATAANTTVGTTTPILTIPVPTGAAANVEYTNGITFSTALCAAVTTGVADNDTGAPAANDFIANIFYK